MIPRLFNEAMDFITDKFENCCSVTPPPRKHFEQSDFDKILRLRTEWEDYNHKVQYKNRHSIQYLVELTNRELNLSKSVYAYRKVWFGKIKKKDMLKGKANK